MDSVGGPGEAAVLSTWYYYVERVSIDRHRNGGPPYRPISAQFS